MGVDHVPPYMVVLVCESQCMVQDYEDQTRYYETRHALRDHGNGTKEEGIRKGGILSCVERSLGQDEGPAFYHFFSWSDL